MSQEQVERVYTINLGKVLLSPNNQRAKRAINMIKEFAARHMKSENIKIEEDVSHLVWARGIRHPPRKIRVMLTKDDGGNVLISKYQEETKTKKEAIVEEKPKPQKSEAVAEEKAAETKEEKVETKPKKPKAEVKPEKPKTESKQEKQKQEAKPAKPKKEEKPEKKVEEKPKATKSDKKIKEK